jgi:hypothetical protein
MPIAFVIGIFFQIFFINHAIKSGKDRYWIFIILMFSAIGCLVYFVVEYLPELRHNRGIRKTGENIMDAVRPGRRLQYWKDQAEITPSVHNKKELAREYINSGMFAEALGLYEECLNGIYADDRALIEGVCCAHFFSGNFEKAEHWLLHLKKIRKESHDNEFDLLYARTLESLGKTDEAIKTYSDLVRKFSGEEARCRYARLLKNCGREKDAMDVYKEVLNNVRLSARYYRKKEKRWVELAKKGISESQCHENI